jgi:hypothetical protein
MKKLFIILILFASVLLVGCTDKKLDNSSASLNNSLPNQAAFATLSDSQGGIDVTIEAIKKENDQTVIELALNNHRYDLSAFDVKAHSSFSGIKPIAYLVNSSAMGGHHVEAEMTFEGELSGLLTIGLDDSLVFNFTIQ